MTQPHHCQPHERKRPRIEMRRGDTLYFVDQLFQDPVSGRYATAHAGDQPPPGMAPANITGFTLWFTAKDDTAIPDVQAPFRLDSASLGGVVVVSAVLGQFSVTGSQLLTQGFADGETRLGYDVQVLDLRGNLFTVEVGELVVVSDFTRALSPWIPGHGPGPIAPQQGGVGPRGPAGTASLTPGVDVSGTTPHAVQQQENWVRFDTSGTQCFANLDQAGLADGEWHILTIVRGANPVSVFSSFGVADADPVPPLIVNTYVFVGAYTSVTVRWDAALQLWFITN